MDQSLFSAPHGLSQSITSFIASYCLGIHQTPFSRLIRSRKSKAVFVVLSPGGRLEDKERSFFRSKVIRFSRLRSPMQGLRRHRLVYLTWNKTTCSAVPEGAPGYRPDAVEPVVLIYSLCTMSKSCVRLDGKTLQQVLYGQIGGLVGRGGFEPPTSRLSGVRSNQLSYRPKLVEPIGIEPMTLCLQSRCSPS